MANETVAIHLCDTSPDGREIGRLVTNSIEHHATRGFDVHSIHYASAATANQYGDARWLTCSALVVYHRNLSGERVRDGEG